MSRIKRTLVCSLVVAVCAAAFAVSAGAASAASKPKSGGAVVYVTQSEARNYDPAKLQVGPIAGANAQVIYDQLFYEDKDGNPTPGLALSLDISNANTVYTIKLRKGVTFTDGTPFDANAVIAHWTRMKDPATASPGLPDAKEIQSMEAVDASTVKVTLVATDATWRVPLMTGNLTYIPSPTAVAKYGAAYGTTPETTVGAGPFKLQELVFGDHQTVVRNANYWDKPKPYVDSLTFKLIADPATRYNTFSTGGADMIQGLTPGPSDVALNNAYPNISPIGFGGGYGFAMNTTKAPTNDPDVRLALLYAVDMNAVLQRGAPGSTWASTLYDKTAPWYLNLPIPNNNLKKAQSLIDGYLKRTGQSSVTVDIIHSMSVPAVMQALQQEWAKVKGLTVNVTLETATATAARIARRDYPNGLVSSVTGTPRGMLLGFNSPASTNLSFLNDPQMDAALKTANETADPAKVKAAMKTVAERYNADAPYMMFNRIAYRVWTSKAVKGIAGMPDAPVVFKSQDMYKTST